jgi:hypothetical protein
MIGASFWLFKKEIYFLFLNKPSSGLFSLSRSLTYVIKCITINIQNVGKIWSVEMFLILVVLDINKNKINKNK